MSLDIRAMEEQDLDRVLKLAADSVEAPLWTRRDYQQTLSSVVPHPLMAAPWIAQTENGLAGFAVVRWLRGEPAAEIENLVVERQHRRQGIGTALIRACLEWAADVGADAVRLEVRESNMAALALYRGLGFAPIGIRRGYYASPPENACILQAPIY